MRCNDYSTHEAVYFQKHMYGMAKVGPWYGVVFGIHGTQYDGRCEHGSSLCTVPLVPNDANSCPHLHLPLDLPATTGLLKTPQEHRPRYCRVIMERRYVCDVYNRQFTRSSHFRRHQASHKDQAVSCTVCNKQFSRTDTL